MATKTVEIEGVGQITLYKRRGVRNIRLSIASAGKIRVTMPYWAPYQAAISFVKSKSAWIAAEAAKRQIILPDGHIIGKSTELKFISDPAAKSIRTKLIDNTARVTLPPGKTYDHALTRSKPPGKSRSAP